ncbi:lysozyme-like [Homalodisca vitripennis]|uniref:lysozyme-like n=1 Tax=Homalodisca vitripennis TaxID=197043 RepID=UPI001EEBF5D1|nr:lysozyme-like [Homalodisca vitripennis]
MSENYLVLFLLSTLFCLSRQDQLVSDKCLYCLCVANTNCNLGTGCTKDEPQVCGPQAITKLYWIDCGELEDSYESCTNNLYCANECIENYMQRYKRDCDGNSEINCLDFAAIHRLGPSGCLTSSLPEDYKNALVNCLKP